MALLYTLAPMYVHTHTHTHTYTHTHTFKVFQLAYGMDYSVPTSYFLWCGQPAEHQAIITIDISMGVQVILGALGNGHCYIHVLASITHTQTHVLISFS